MADGADKNTDAENAKISHLVRTPRTAAAEEVIAEELDTSASEEQLAALRLEIDRLKDTVQQIASSSSQLAAAEIRQMVSTTEERLQQNVFLAVGVAALFGYIFGRSR